MAQFRCGILPIRIETGRYVGERPEGRLCKICSINSIESETHFLLHCNHYADFRQTLFSYAERTEGSQTLTDIEKANVLMSSYPGQTAKYILNAFNKRKQFFYVNN